MRRKPPTEPKIVGILCEFFISELLYLFDGVIFFGEVNNIEIKAEIAKMFPWVRDLVVLAELTTAVMALTKHEDFH